VDCLVVNVRENQRVITKALYLVLGVDLNGQKELLGMGIAQSEGAKFWLSVLTELQNRGVKDLFIACVDGLTGLPEAIETVYPREPGAIVHGASGEELLALGVVQAHESSRDRPQSHLLSQH
jgi:transposase-like protein